MNPDADDLLLFARVAEAGSFSRAAERVQLPKSTVSRRIAALEKRLGERLLQRTTRKLVITEFGQGVLDHARALSEEVDAALAFALSRQSRPSGRLRVSMPGDFASAALEKPLAGFIRDFPDVSLELDLSPRRVDLIGENFDLAIRMGDLPDDASLAARPLANFSLGLYASPAYLKKRGVPPEPEALMEHDGLHLLTRSGDITPWSLKRGDSVWEGVPPTRARANSPELLVRLARSGAGITIVGDHFAAPYIHSGELMPLLVDWYLPSAQAWAVFPGRRLMPASTRVFLDAMQAEFAGPRCHAAQQEAEALREEGLRSLEKRAAAVAAG